MTFAYKVGHILNYYESLILSKRMLQTY